MKRKIALLAFAVAALAVAGLGVGARGASAAPGLSAYSGGPYAGIAGSAIQFDGSASSGFGLSYYWTFGDGTSAVGARPVKAYAAPGVYTVTLTVQDYTGHRSVAATTATIHGSRVVVPGGCITTVTGAVFCGQTVSSLYAGCVWTAAGYVCPWTTLTPGVIVTNLTYPYTTLVSCDNPNYAHTPFCKDPR